MDVDNLREVYAAAPTMGRKVGYLDFVVSDRAVGEMSKSYSSHSSGTYVDAFKHNLYRHTYDVYIRMYICIRMAYTYMNVYMYMYMFMYVYWIRCRKATPHILQVRSNSIHTQAYICV
jgi:hypothetical protein